MTDEPICDASVTSNDGKTEMPLTSVGRLDCVYVDVAEQLGTFQVSIEKAGYQPAAITVVVDDEDECHVITKDVSVTLVPE